MQLILTYLLFCYILIYRIFEEKEKWKIQNGYQLGLSLERIDVNGNYEPSNCTWITKGQQQHNKTNTVYLTYNNETHNLMEWAEITGMGYHCLKSRYARGWETERILTQPKQKRT